MTDRLKLKNINCVNSPQCQFFVVRKKRLCRMTVRPGNQYCGEHTPAPKENETEVDTRMPCPLDPKHSCFISKLEKHLQICNARQLEQPPYICKNVNVLSPAPDGPRPPLNSVAQDDIAAVINKINSLYLSLVSYNISQCPNREVHPAVAADVRCAGRARSSLRHLHQVSSILWLLQHEGLMSEEMCYVELGAGKGQLSYFVQGACGGRVVAVERAALRHKRDNKLSPRLACRLRADLADLALERTAAAADVDVVAVAKHLCGDAIDLALRCVTRAGVRTRGAVLATCCHHRCRGAELAGRRHLAEMGITEEDLNIILGVVSWATCGDGRPHTRREKDASTELRGDHDLRHDQDDTVTGDKTRLNENDQAKAEQIVLNDDLDALDREQRKEIGRRAKALLDWSRVMYLRERGFEARLVEFVDVSVTPENICIVAKKIPNNTT